MKKARGGDGGSGSDKEGAWSEVGQGRIDVKKSSVKPSEGEGAQAVGPGVKAIKEW